MTSITPGTPTSSTAHPSEPAPVESTAHSHGHLQPDTPRWVRWAPLAALAWSVSTVAWTSIWALELLPHPFAAAEEVALGAVFNGYDPVVGLSATAVIAGLGTVTALMSLRPSGGLLVRRALVVIAWILAAALALVMVSGRLLIILGYGLLVPALGWFEPGLAAEFLSAALEPATIFVVGSAIGAGLWGAVALTGQRALRRACIACGRAQNRNEQRDHKARIQALRVGRVAVAFAAAMALTYPAVRLPWLLGLAAGMDGQTWAQLQASGDIRIGIGLGLAAVGGVVLMTGLISRWGERFPGWMVGLGGRRVPISLAVVPAATLALALVATGRGALPAILSGQGLAGGSWAQVVPVLSMLPWGIALAVATAAYLVRRKGVCAGCDSHPASATSMRHQ